MQRRRIATRGFIVGALVLQLVPLVLFPPESFSPNSQEWWLPVLLAAMVLVACAQLILLGSQQLWPWHLMSFSQGLNIISRLMMIWPHATKTVGGATVLNGPYVALTLTAMAMSAFLLWYLELPEVRVGLLRD
jgi:cyanate permease